MQFMVADVTFNNVHIIEYNQFAGFHLYSYIKQGLPYGFININDRSSEFFAKFPSIQVGATVDITLVDVDNPDNKRKFPKYRVLKIENDFSVDTSIFAGVIKVWFGHPWFLFKDIKNHAYKEENIGELIKKILRNEDRGISFSYKKDGPDFGKIETDISELGQEDDNGEFDFDKTDDTGKFTRFKVAETDWDFIHHKLLPHTSISLLPAHLYCDERYGMFHLKSFRSLYRQKPKILFHQREEALSDPDAWKQVRAICEKHNIPLGGGNFSVYGAQVIINEFEFLQEIFPTFYLESLQNGTFITGSKRLGNQVNQRSGPTFGNVLPLDQALMGKLAGSSVKITQNRQLEDALMLLFQTSKYLDELFKLKVVSYFTGDLLCVGNTAEVYIQNVTVDEDLVKAHWMNGKWLVTGVEYYNDEEDVRRIMSSTLLIRPTFVGHDDFSSLDQPEALYES